MDAGVDSLNAVELIDVLQAQAREGERLPATLLFEYPTARQLAAALRPSSNVDSAGPQAIWEPHGNSFEHCGGFVALCSISAAMAGGLHILGSIGHALGGAQDLATHVPITRWGASDEANLGLSSLEARAREQTRRPS